MIAQETADKRVKACALAFNNGFKEGSRDILVKLIRELNKKIVGLRSWVKTEELTNQLKSLNGYHDYLKRLLKDYE